nr:U3 small nucleolar ribonucleoprotein protein MPP10-like isoform X2 [Oncorhynchus gorbuscha]
MAEKIQDLEKAVMGEKPWQLTGDVSAQTRPENSLLEVDVAFDSASRMAPAVTEETTLQLEDIIKQRIKDQEKNKAGDVLVDSEKTSTDKKRERRKKKKVKSIKMKEKRRKLKDRTGENKKQSMAECGRKPQTHKGRQINIIKGWGEG